MLGLQNEREWQEFCARVLEQPALANDERFSSNARRVAAREALQAIIVDVFSRLNTDQVVARLETAQIANARVNSMRDVWEHAQLRARRRWTQVETPAGAVPALLPPGIPDTFAPRMDPVPALGQHSARILAELGYSADEIESLAA
jgi:itaconate CoA-transferase